MVNKVFPTILLILFASCGGIKVRFLNNKTTAVPFDNNIFNKNIYDRNFLTIIDTVALYKLEYGFVTSKNSFKASTKNRYYSSSSNIAYYKFYKNGCVNLFSFHNQDSITINSLNPELNGQRGIVYKKNNGLKLGLFTIVGYGYGPEYGIVGSTIIIKDDTIFEKKDKNIEYINVYIKQKIPKEFLIYKPDW